MQSTNSNNIKRLYEEFSQKSGFQYHNSESVVAPANSRLLFNISGGVKFQDELLELKPPVDPKVSSIQKCIRTDSIEKIGFSERHHLFFEMLGHFMFYCLGERETKREFIRFAYGFLTDVIGLDKKRIRITVYPQDEICLGAWSDLGIKNIAMNEKNIFVSPYADKSALRTEILWQKDPGKDEYVELWNLVFTQFNSKTVFEKSSSLVGADSGASLERIVTATENKVNNYENSMWNDFINEILASRNCDINIARKIADLSNTAFNLMNEGLVPGNKVQLYMLRKMLRILYDLCDDYSIDINCLINTYIKYSFLPVGIDKLLQLTIDEQEKYNQSIQNGLRLAKKEIQKRGIDNVSVEYLRSTCGLSEKYIAQIRCRSI